MKVELLQTNDGSHTLFVPELNETYHSRKSAIKESQAVYIDKGLAHVAPIGQPAAVHLLEVGFGTGLNIWLSMLYAAQHGTLEVAATTLEPFPLDQTIWQQLNYAALLPHHPSAESWFHAIHMAPWDCWVQLTPNFRLHKRRTTLEAVSLDPESFDLIYFDAFAPSKQPAIWSSSNFRSLHQAMKPNAWLSTYCASSLFKKTLKENGFEVVVSRGPMGKREMVNASKE